jgi:Holin of 3TMs, for gene-transfer release
MSFDPATALFDLAKVAIEKVFPDPLKRAEQLERLEKLKQDGELAKMQAEVSLLLGQIEINKVEAAHPSIFVSGWRPFIGWTAGIALFMYYVPFALVSLVVWAIACYHAGAIVDRPNLDISDLVGLIAAMLGVVVPRSIERVKGVAIERISK